MKAIHKDAQRLILTKLKSLILLKTLNRLHRGTIDKLKALNLTMKVQKSQCHKINPQMNMIVLKMKVVQSKKSSLKLLIKLKAS